MAERLEDSGLSSQQSRAVIEAIANSIEKFSVTPVRLSAEFERHGESMKKYIDQGLDRVHERFDLVNKKFELVDKKFDLVIDRFGLVDKKFGLVDEKFGGVNEKFDGVYGRLDRLESLMKTAIGWQIASLTLFAGTLTGLVGVLAVRLL